MESRKVNTQEVDNRLDKLTDSVNKLVEVIIPTEPTEPAEPAEPIEKEMEE